MASMQVVVGDLIREAEVILAAGWEKYAEEKFADDAAGLPMLVVCHGGGAGCRPAPDHVAVARAPAE